MIHFTATGSALAVSAAAHDMFWLKASSVNSIAIRRIHLGQYSDPGDAEAEMLSVQAIRGYTTSPSGGAACTPRAADTRRPAFGAEGTGEECRVNDTTVATTGTPHILAAEAFNVMGGWYWRVPDGDHLLPRKLSRAIWIAPGETFALRITAPADALTMNVSVDFDEMTTTDVDN